MIDNALKHSESIPVDAALLSEAADEIERLRVENRKLAGYLMHELVFVHERLIEEVDNALKPYLGMTDDGA